MCACMETDNTELSYDVENTEKGVLSESSLRRFLSGFQVAPTDVGSLSRSFCYFVFEDPDSKPGS